MNKFIKSVIAVIFIISCLWVPLLLLIKVDIFDDCFIIKNEDEYLLAIQDETFTKIKNLDKYIIKNKNSIYEYDSKNCDWTYNFNIKLWTTSILIIDEKDTNISQLKIFVSSKNVLGINL